MKERKGATIERKEAEKIVKTLTDSEKRKLALFISKIIDSNGKIN